MASSEPAPSGPVCVPCQARGLLAGWAALELFGDACEAVRNMPSSVVWRMSPGLAEACAVIDVDGVVVCTAGCVGQGDCVAITGDPDDGQREKAETVGSVAAGRAVAGSRHAGEEGAAKDGVATPECDGPRDGVATPACDGSI